MGIDTDLDHPVPHPDLERGHHHEGKPGLLARVARFSANHRKSVMAAWLLLTLAPPLALTLNGAPPVRVGMRRAISQDVRNELRRDFPR
jgi:hypothetical protein